MWDGSFFAHRIMNDEQANHLTDAELKAFFNRPILQGFTRTDLLAVISPAGW
jgi:hypothetical protein